MKKITKSIALLLTAALLFCGLSFSVYAVGEIAVYVDGTQVKFDAQPRIIENRTMVPMRAIFEAIGATVNWNAETRTASSTFRGTTVSITVGTNILLKNNTEIPLDVPAQVVESRTLVPVRAIAESFDCKVEWLGDIRTVRIVTTDFDSLMTEKDKSVHMTVGSRNFSEAFYSAYAADGSMSEEEILEFFKSLAAYEKYAEEKNYIPSILEYDALDGWLKKQLDAGNIAQSPDPKTGMTVYTRREIARDALLAQYVGYFSSFDYLADMQSLLPYVKEKAVRVKHILVGTKEEADAVTERLKNGEKFENLVTELSLDGMNSETGYVFGDGEMVEEFEKASYALKVGETSEPIQSQYGYHIIRRYSFDGMKDEEILSATGERFLSTYCLNMLYKDIAEIAKTLAVTYPQVS